MLKYGFIFVYIQNGDTEMNFSLGESFSGSDYFQVSLFKLMFLRNISREIVFSMLLLL